MRYGLGGDTVAGGQYRDCTVSRLPPFDEGEEGEDAQRTPRGINQQASRNRRGCDKSRAVVLTVNSDEVLAKTNYF